MLVQSKQGAAFPVCLVDSLFDVIIMLRRNGNGRSAIDQVNLKETVAYI